MRKHTRRILHGPTGHSLARSTIFAMLAGCLAAGATPAQAQQATLSFSGGFVLPNHFEAPFVPGPVPMSSRTIQGMVRMPAIQPGWVSSAAAAVTTNSTVAWLAGFQTDVTAG